MKLIERLYVIEKAVNHYPEYEEEPEVIRYYEKLAKWDLIVKQTPYSMVVHFHAPFERPENYSVKKPIEQKPYMAELRLAQG